MAGAGSTPSPVFEMSHLIALYSGDAGEVKTNGQITFPFGEESASSQNPVIHMDVETDFKSRIATTLDIGPTNPTKDLSTFPEYNSNNIPIYIDPGWLDVVLGMGTIETQPAWGGQLFLRHLIVKCEAGAIALTYGALDPFNESTGSSPAEIRPFILQEGGIFAQSFKGTRAATTIINPGPLGDHLTPTVQGVPSLVMQTFEDLNRVKILAFVERYNLR